VTVKLGTVEFYQAMAEQLNNDPEWKEKGAKLTHSMAFVYEGPIEGTFYLDFHEGRVIEVREATPADLESADFVISGSSDSWRAVFTKEMAPAAALAKKALAVQGKMSVLLKNMAAFQYILEAMTRVDFE
jgi:putative sterol carrier protein